MVIERSLLQDSKKLFMDYWEKNIRHAWNMDSDAALRFADGAMDDMRLYAAFENGECRGLLVNEEGARNAIWLLHVVPERRRQGIGTQLFDQASLHVGGDWHAGSGTGYWWQGVPIGCGDEFLQKRGFAWTWTSVDMVLDLSQWMKPTSASLSVNIDVRIGRLKPGESAQLIEMVEAEPDLQGWTQYYRDMVEAGQGQRILVARDGGDIVGCVMILVEDDIRWRPNGGGKIGGIGCLGVRKACRGKGLGMGLAVAVTDELKSMGYDLSYVGYTWLEDWYGQIGYKTLFRQRMGCKPKSSAGIRT